MMVCPELLEFETSLRLTLVTGGRGIDANSKTVNGVTNVVYPIYDAHGNMVADVSKYGSSFQVNDKRSFDAWGNIRQGAQTGDPKGRYCANLGHKQDDESGLIYMRARYYEPTSGRFLSEDLQRSDFSFFVYAGADPVNNVDSGGNMKNTVQWAEFWQLFAIVRSALALIKFCSSSPEAMIVAVSGLSFLAAWFADVSLPIGTDGPTSLGAMLSFTGLIGGTVTGVYAIGRLADSSSPAFNAVAVCQTYALLIAIMIAGDDYAND